MTWNLAIGIAIWLPAIGAWIGIGLIGKWWLEWLSRNPEAWGKMFVPGILALAFAEAVAIYGFVIAFMTIG